MTKFELDALAVTKMASGHLCLDLTETLGWEDFPEFATELADKIGATIVEKGDAPDVRLWTLEVKGARLSLVFDDYPAMTSLESSDAAGDKVITDLYESFSRA